MALPLEGTRVLSPLERDAVNLVFQKSIDPWDISLTIVEEIPSVVSTYHGGGKIRINKSALPHTQALNINSTFKYLDLTHEPPDSEQTEPFRPGNMHYLSTLIHECVHYWQELYGVCTDPEGHRNPLYDFTHAQLQQRDLSEEQHASAGQVYFLLAWQLCNQPDGYNVDLTTQPPNRVGPADRYNLIDLIGHTDGRRIVSSKVAEDRVDDFCEYRDILKDKGRPSHISSCR